MAKTGQPKRNGSGQGVRKNAGRGGCAKPRKTGKSSPGKNSGGRRKSAG